MKITHLLALISLMRSEFGMIEDKDVEPQEGCIIHLCASSLTSWEGIEGVRMNRTPKPVTVQPKGKKEVKKMFVMSTHVLNDEYHTFNNLIILN